MNEETILLRGLSIGYQQKKSVSIVAEGIDAAILRGELTCLLGANGVGKSTLLRTLSAFQPKIGGEILISNQSTERELSSYTDKELSRLIGVVLTEKPDIRNMTVREIVGLGRSPYTGFWGILDADDWVAVDDAIGAVGIKALEQRLIETLSDGERQKVMIAKALAQGTPVIYLDEPTAFLDFPSKVEMMQLLHRLAHEQQKTIFMSTHDFELALQVADRLWLMERGHLSIGTPEQLAEEGSLSRYVDRPGIHFDAATLTVRVER